ncbi:MAG: transposase family protein [Pirellulales bacterium]
MIAIESLVRVFSQVEDPRKPQGVRHPMQGMRALVFLGLLARIREMGVLNRWATEHWEQLREPLGFDRDKRPHATTISRSLAKCDLSSFARAYLAWIQQMLPPEATLVAAVDAKTSCQGIDADGDPVQLVTALVHNLKVVIGQWSVRGEKTNGSGVLKNHLAQL